MTRPRYLAGGRFRIDRSIYKHDGDSFLVDFDLGHGVWLYTVNHDFKNIVRLADVDCPEWYKKGGQEAREFTEQWMAEASNFEREAYLTIETIKKDSFGRWLSYVQRLSDGNFLHHDLIKHGHDTGKRWKN